MPTCLDPPTRRNNPIFIVEGGQGVATPEFSRYLEELGCAIGEGSGGGSPQPGAPGSKIYVGDGPPAPATGADTDVYFDAVSGDIYQKDNATWELKGAIPGRQEVFYGATLPAGVDWEAVWFEDAEINGVQGCWLNVVCP